MIFSFATIYEKVKNRMQKRGYIPIDPSLSKKQEILKVLIDICDKYNMQMEACCQPDLIDNDRINQASCINCAYQRNCYSARAISEKFVFCTASEMTCYSLF